MTRKQLNPRAVWRIVRLTARYYDSTWPNWWSDPRVLETIARKDNHIATRCWQHAVRLRTGD